MHHIILATNNPHKIQEYKHMFDILQYPVDIANINFKIPDNIEQFDDYQSNAIIKALYVKHYIEKILGKTISEDTLILAEDSGFEIDKLNGFPGIKSKRWIYDYIDNKNINPYANKGEILAQMLLRKINNELPNTQIANLTAKMIAIIGAVWNDKIYIGEGILHGTLTPDMRGNYGWAYDKIFIPNPFDPHITQITNQELVQKLHNKTLTLAELPTEYKNFISHRRKAVENLIENLSFYRPYSLSKEQQTLFDDIITYSINEYKNTNVQNMVENEVQHVILSYTPTNTIINKNIGTT